MCSLAWVSNPPAPDSSPEVSVRCSCLVVPNIAPWAVDYTHRVGARVWQHVCGKNQVEAGNSLGAALVNWQWCGFGYLERSVGIKRRQWRVCFIFLL